MGLEILAAIAGPIIGAIGANSAAKKQARAANQQMDLARETRDLTRADLAPFVEPGQGAVNALLYEFGLGPQPEGYGGYTASPGYNALFQEGVRAIDASAAGRGDLYSGNTGKRLTEFGQGLAAQDYGNHINRLFGIAGNAQSAAAGLGAANAGYGAAGATALANRGDAQAAGVTGITNALTTGIDNYLGYKTMNDLLATYKDPGIAAVRPPLRPA